MTGLLVGLAVTGALVGLGVTGRLVGLTVTGAFVGLNVTGLLVGLTGGLTVGFLDGEAGVSDKLDVGGALGGDVGKPPVGTVETAAIGAGDGDVAAGLTISTRTLLSPGAPVHCPAV